MFARTRREGPDAGFSLPELLVVCVILGVLAAIAIPLFIVQRQKGYDAEVRSDLRNAAIAEESHLGDAGFYTTDIGTTSTNAVQYRKSPSVSAVSAFITDSTGAKISDSTGADGFCLTAKSQSGSWFAWNSLRGGLQSASYDSAAAACP